jgi:ketosteroid isomerase-like protein
MTTTIGKTFGAIPGQLPANYLVVAIGCFLQHAAVMQSLTPNLENWLRRFVEVIRNRDYVAARKLFADDVISFGTVCFRVETLDALASSQWKIAWPNFRNFNFEFGSAGVHLEAEQAVVIVNWKATDVRRDDPSSEIRGRATIVLQNTNSEWKAIHTHFSLKPERETV